ncbi:MAG: hypothetical protein WCG92_17025 [Hyphomicrobiales bacterium]
MTTGGGSTYPAPIPVQTNPATSVDPSGRLGTPPVTVVEAARLDRLKALYARSIEL